MEGTQQAPIGEYYAWIRELILPYALEAGFNEEFDLHKIHSTGGTQSHVTFTVGDDEASIDVTFRGEDIT